MFLKDVWNAIATVADSFVNMLRHPSGPLMPASPKRPLPSTSAATPYIVASDGPSPSFCAGTPYTAGPAPPNISPSETMFVTPLVPLPPVPASELRAATRCLFFPATPIPETRPQLLAPIQLNARPPLPGCSPYALPWSSSAGNHEQGIQLCPEIQIKSEPIESEELLFNDASNMDTLPFVALVDTASIKIEKRVKMEPMDFHKTLQNMESIQKEFKIEPNEATEANVYATVEMAEVTDENAPCMQEITVASAQDGGKVLGKADARPALQETILSAVRTLRDRNGSSAQAIKRYLSHQASISLPADNSLFNISLKKLVEYGSLIQTKGTGARGSFKLAVEINNNDAKPFQSKRQSIRPSPKISERTKVPRRNLTAAAKKFTLTNFVRSTRRTSKLHNESLKSKVTSDDKSFISTRPKISCHKKDGVKELTKVTNKAKKGKRLRKEKMLNELIENDNSIPYATWHQMHSVKWNIKLN